MTMPMVPDFAIRLAGGLAAMLLLAPWRVIPPAFFRTHCLVMLALFSVASLFEGRAVPVAVLAATIFAAALAYLGSIAWAVGLPRVASPLSAAMAATSAALLAWASSADPGGTAPGAFALAFAARLASAALLGSTLTAMLLGHHYLTAPAMAIDPLRRFVAAMAWSLGTRTILAGVGLATWLLGMAGASASTDVDWPLFLGMRWGMGLAGPALATYLTWKTVQIRSTQSATGILYIAMTLVLFGEPAALILARETGVVL